MLFAADTSANMVFPAHAGMSPSRLMVACDVLSFPRTRGDEPRRSQSIRSRTVFSPHTRG